VPPLHPPQSVCGGSRGGAAYPLRTTARLPTTPHARGKEIGVADAIETKDFETPRASTQAHDAGTFIGQCVDVINLGTRPEVYQGEDKGLTPKLALVFVTGERAQDGSLIQVSVELTISTGPKAKLRQYAEAWRGKAYPEDYPNIPVHKFVGLWASLTIVQQQSKKGNTYAKVTGISGVPRGMPTPADLLAEYETAGRGDWWEKRKTEYATETAAYKERTAKRTPAPPPTFDDEPPLPEYEGEDDESLPF
jgi:hypothetical protein